MSYNMSCVIVLIRTKYHPPANKLKMGSGNPLTDADRRGWLVSLREDAVKKLRACDIVIVSCSALKRMYRDEIRIASRDNDAVQVCFIHLQADAHSLDARVKARVGHYMRDNMVPSQMDTLEEPTTDETDVRKIDSRQDQAIVCRKALDVVQLKLKNRKVSRLHGSQHF